MKRPSGFDRGGDEGSPELERDDEPRPFGVTGSPDSAGDAPAERVSGAFQRMLRRRGAFGKNGGGPEAPEAGADAMAGVEPAEAAEAEPAPSAQEGTGFAEGHEVSEASEAPEAAPTVDLSEVREARAGRLVKAGADEDPVRAAELRLRAAGRERKAAERRERRRFSVAARRRRRNWLIAAGTVVALAIFVLAGVYTPLMAVRDVQLSGVEAVNADDVEKALSRFEGVPLALVSDRDVYEALEPFPLIQRYAIELIPPHTLVVRIEERVPVVALDRGGSFELYDAAGVLVGGSAEPPAGVPIGGGGVSDLGSRAFDSASRALRDMPAELRAQIASVSATSGQDITFALTSGIEVFWGDADRSRQKSVVLQTMLASLAERPVSHIDVSSTEAPVFR